MYHLLAFLFFATASGQSTPPWLVFIGGYTGFGIISYAVQTFPVPESKWGRWLLGIAQKAVLLTERGANTMAGLDTVSVAVPKDAAGKSQAEAAGQIASNAVADVIASPYDERLSKSS